MSPIERDEKRPKRLSLSKKSVTFARVKYLVRNLKGHS